MAVWIAQAIPESVHAPPLCRLNGMHSTTRPAIRKNAASEGHTGGGQAQAVPGVLLLFRHQRQEQV
jgi:hypothetical protein